RITRTRLSLRIRCFEPQLKMNRTLFATNLHRITLLLMMPDTARVNALRTPVALPSHALPTSNCSTDVLRLRDHRKRQELNRSRNGPSTFSIHARRNVRTKCAHLPSPISNVSTLQTSATRAFF